MPLTQVGLSVGLSQLVWPDGGTDTRVPRVEGNQKADAGWTECGTKSAGLAGRPD